MKRFLFLAGVCLLALSASAKRVIDISKKGEGKIAINLGAYHTAGDAASRSFLSVLKADLNRSGYFTVVSSGGQVSVTGSCAPSGGQLKAGCAVYKTATRQRVLGKSYNGSVSAARALAHKVADEILFAVTGKKGMASGKLALVLKTGRVKELVVCDMDGKNPRQITKDRSIVVDPHWTPGGKNLTYTSYKRGYPNVFLHGRSKPMSSYAGLNTGGAVSPDGKSVALILSRDGNPELYVKSLRTGLLKRLTRTSRGNEASPCWSPDGKYIAFVSDTSGRPQIYTISQSGGAARRLTTSGSECVSPDWGINGYIAYSTRTGGRYRIAVAHPDGKSVRILETDWADYEDPSWAPDGRHIVCSRTSNHRSSIYLLDTLKDSPVALISGSGDWISPTCSP